MNFKELFEIFPLDPEKTHFPAWFMTIASWEFQKTVLKLFMHRLCVKKEPTQNRSTAREFRFISSEKLLC